MTVDSLLSTSLLPLHSNQLKSVMMPSKSLSAMFPSDANVPKSSARILTSSENLKRLEVKEKEKSSQEGASLQQERKLMQKSCQNGRCEVKK